MAWVFIHKFNIDVCLLINDYITNAVINEVIDSLTEPVKDNFKNLFIQQLTDEYTALCDVWKLVQIAKNSNILTPYIKNLVKRWREKEGYIHQYQDGYYIHHIELLRWKIDNCCEHQ